MNYYIKEIQTNGDMKKTAGIKARDDACQIMEDIGFKCLTVSKEDLERIEASTVKKVKSHFSAYSDFSKGLSDLHSGDCVLIQYPIINHTFLFPQIMRQLKKRNVKIILLIHDLETIHQGKRENISFRTKLRIASEEKPVLKDADVIIAHNDRMKSLFGQMNLNAQIVSLEIFDYLIPDYNKEKIKRRIIAKDEPVIIAGNLRPHKAKYIYDLPNKTEFNLYGIGFDESKSKENIHYKGSFLANEIPYNMNGSFGLVWDGNSIDTCSGIYGEYLKVNNPHKTSLYLASGIPVIIWKEAALADFVIQNRCGLCVHNLHDIEDILKSISKEEYNDMVQSTVNISKKLRTGYYLKNTITKSNM